MEGNKLQKTDGAKREVERSLERMDMGEGEGRMSRQADVMNREGNEGYAKSKRATGSSSGGRLLEILVSRETEMTSL